MSAKVYVLKVKGSIFFWVKTSSDFFFRGFVPRRRGWVKEGKGLKIFRKTPLRKFLEMGGQGIFFKKEGGGKVKSCVESLPQISPL